MNYMVPVRYTAGGKNSSELFHGNFIGGFFKSSPISAGAYCLTSLLQYSAPLFYIYILSTLVLGDVDATFVIRQSIYLALFSLLNYALSLAKLNLDRIFSLQYCRGFEAMISKKFRLDAKLQVLERIAARDFNLILDSFGAAVDLIVIPAFLLFAALAALLIFGSAGLWAVVVVLIFLPVSYVLSKLSDRNYQRIMEATADRIEKCSAWIREGPFIRQFGKMNELDEISRSLRRELFRRNLDSALRGADSYLIGFGRLIPYVVFVTLGGLTSTTVWNGTIFWLSIPLLSAVLSLPRAYLAYKNITRSQYELSLLSPGFEFSEISTDDSSQNDGNIIEFDRNWPIWPAKLGDLLPAGADFPASQLRTFLESFRLIPEIGNNTEEVFERFIEIDGRNLSDGQLLRLQLLRGVFLVKVLGTTLHVNDSFSALDPAAGHAVAHALNSQANVTLGRESVIAMEAFDARHDAIAPQPPSTEVAIERQDGARFALSDLLKAIKSGIFLLLIPAAMLSYSANLTLPGGRFSVLQILLYAVVGISLGILCGLFIEDLLRRRFAHQFFQGLRDIRTGDISNAVQLVSRDITTAFERIAWYAHDICWVIALLLCSVVSLWNSFGAFGIVLAFLFVLALVVIYLIFIDELYETRVDSVAGFDGLIKSVQLTFVFSKDFGSGFSRVQTWLNATKQFSITRGIEKFYVTRMRSIVSRTMMAMSCKIVGDSIIVLVAYFGNFYKESTSQFVLATTILLIIRSDLSNFFLAITGFKSQSISIDRLQAFSRQRSKVPIFVDDNTIKISGFFARRSYRALVLEKGFLYSFSGSSGSGKSDYLKGVAGIIDVHASNSSIEGAAIPKIYYLDKHVPNYIFSEDSCKNERLQEWLESLPSDGQQVIFLDEIFSDLTEEMLFNHLQMLDRYARCSTNTVVVVDHRSRLGKNIELVSIIN